ncbi:MAG: enoyl-CoA hydratase/isomerase family protein [Fidelibacterota bacterium]
MKEYNYIKLEIGDKVGRIVFNRSPLNIMNMQMLDEMISAVKSLSTQNLRVCVLSGEGRAFSAGVDVGEHVAEKASPMLQKFHAFFHALRDLPIPTVALVKGAALGGGCEIAIFCDIVLASKSAVFGQPEIKVGVFPPVAIVHFPSLIGLKRSFELILTGSTISAERAAQIGLINAVFPDDAFDEETERWIAKLSGLSGVVLSFTKRALNLCTGKDFEEALAIAEDIYLNELMQTEDANEGLSAFLEKRPPVWKDK